MFFVFIDNSLEGMDYSGLSWGAEPLKTGLVWWNTQTWQRRGLDNAGAQSRAKGVPWCGNSGDRDPIVLGTVFE